MKFPLPKLSEKDGGLSHDFSNINRDVSGNKAGFKVGMSLDLSYSQFTSLVAFFIVNDNEGLGSDDNGCLPTLRVNKRPGSKSFVLKLSWSLLLFQG